MPLFDCSGATERKCLFFYNTTKKKRHGKGAKMAKEGKKRGEREGIIMPMDEGVKHPEGA